MKEWINTLYEQVTKTNAGEGHVQIHGIKNDHKAVAVISVYHNQRPSHLVLDELYQWAEANGLVMVIEKIHQLEKGDYQ